MFIEHQITLAIITYQRPKLLEKCLRSLCQQSLSPNKIIIIDNDPQKSSQHIFKKYKKKLPLQYFVEIQKGAPVARNTAVQLVKTKYIAFIDDDCVLDSNWFQTISQFINKKPSAYVIGRSLLQNQKNVFAQAQFNYYQQWFYSKIKEPSLSPELFDTKNIVINCSLFKKNNFKFDKLFANSPISGFEDVDMGFQFAKNKLVGLYCPEMIVYHQELDTFTKMVKKSYERGRLKYLLNKKWKIKETFNPNIFKNISGIIKKIIKTPKKSLIKIINIFLIEIIDYSFKVGYNYQKNQ